MRPRYRRRSLVTALLIGVCSAVPSATAGADKADNAVSEAIWALEHAYFASLYKADYDGVLAPVHPQFLAWPGAAAHPIDRDASARFMRQLVARPTSCAVAIDREGMRVLGAVALTQYTLNVTCPGVDGTPTKQTSRITHTWVKEGASWKLLGGMSFDKP